MGTGELCKMPSVVLVNGFLVHPSMRGRGIGREMFENLVSYLRFMQTQEESLKLFKVCILHSEPKNALFWKHLGCVAFDPGYLCPSDALRIQMLEKISNSRFLMFKL
jgi:GNAT superfamily N-acetyltransferase